MASGAALSDYNNNGLLDVYVVNGATIPGLNKDNAVYYNRLFKNKGDGTFEDVTPQATVQGRGYNLGVVIGDYDNDGFADIFVARLQGNILYHNNGDRTFTDVTSQAGLDRPDRRCGYLWATGGWQVVSDTVCRHNMYSGYATWNLH
jgi:hypothetical protein